MWIRKRYKREWLKNENRNEWGGKEKERKRYKRGWLKDEKRNEWGGEENKWVGKEKEGRGQTSTGSSDSNRAPAEEVADDYGNNSPIQMVVIIR